MMKKVFLLLGALIYLLLPGMALADSISPSIFSGSGPVGAIFTVHKTLTIDTDNSSTAYSTVSIDVSEAPSAVGMDVTPDSFTGSYDRSITRIFNFEVEFTALQLGTYPFDIYGMVNSFRVATERDSITAFGTPVPEPSTMLLLGSGLIGLLGFRKKFKK